MTLPYSFNDSINYETGEKFNWKGNLQCWNHVLSEYRLSESFCLVDEFENLDKEISVIIYGAGETGREVIQMLKQSNITISGIAVSDITKNASSIDNIPVLTIDSYQKNSKIIIAIQDNIEANKVKEKLELDGYNNSSIYNIFS